MMEAPKRVRAEDVRASLEAIVDPQSGLNIIDLGLIYGIRVEKDRIEVDMTLTNPESPTAGTLATEVEQAVRGAFEEIDNVEVSLVFEPPWTLECLSDKGRATLGYRA